MTVLDPVQARIVREIRVTTILDDESYELPRPIMVDGLNGYGLQVWRVVFHGEGSATMASDFARQQREAITSPGPHL